MTYATYLLKKGRNSVKANLRNHEYRKFYLLHWFKKSMSLHIDVTFYKLNVIRELTYAMIVRVIIESSWFC